MRLLVLQLGDRRKAVLNQGPTPAPFYRNSMALGGVVAALAMRDPAGAR
jgi:hypothetical protein